MTTALISSTQNAWIKRLQKLVQKSRTRKLEKAFVVEGERELVRALVNGYSAEAIFLPENETLPTAVASANKTLPKPFFISSDLFQKISLRSGTEKVIAILEAKTHHISDFNPQQQGLYLLAVGIEKPGNLGALLRTAAGAGLSGVVVVDAVADLYNPNCIRNSLGGVFSLPIAVSKAPVALDFFKQKNWPIYSAALHEAAKNYQDINYPKTCVLAVGSEAHGLTDTWLQAAKASIQIPMHAPIDSLNVSVAAAVLSYHIRMQQNQV